MQNVDVDHAEKIRDVFISAWIGVHRRL